MTPAEKGSAVFVHTCSACERRQLIFPSQFTAVAAGEQGPVATFTCWCGAEQTASVNWAPAAPAREPVAA